MKKNIVEVIKFLFEDSGSCQKTSDGIIIRNKMLKIILNSNQNIPEYLNITIKEGIDTIATEQVSAESMKLLLLDVWDTIEKETNKDFIKEYGKDFYNKLHDQIIEILKGNLENDLFNIEIDRTSDVLSIYMEDKKEKITNCLSINYKNNEELKVHDALFLSGNILVPTNEKGYKWKSVQLTVVVPIIDVDNYPILNLSIKRNYDKENILDYLLSEIKDKNVIKVLSAFKLKTELSKKEEFKNTIIKI